MTALLIIIGAAAGLVVVSRVIRWARLSARSGIFEGKVVLLTGASRGIGRELALALAARGAHLVLAARRVDQLEATAADCAARNPRVETLIVPTDVTDESQLEHLVSEAERRFGRIDILVNNAGILQAGGFTAVGPDSVRKTIEVNLLAPMRLTQIVLPLMRRQGSGHIVNISSAGGRHGAPFFAAYCASKHGLVGFGESLRRELAGTGIHVLTVNPGYTQTDMVEVAQIAYRKMGFGIIPVERVIRRTLEGIALGRPEVFIGWLETFGGWVSKLFPGLADLYWRLLMPPDYEAIVSGQRSE